MDEIEKALESLQLCSVNDEAASQAITILAEASRSSEATRQQLADPKILDALIEAIDCGLDESLETVDVALKCIGNACIDNNAAREILTSRGFAWASRCLVYFGVHRDVSTAMLATKVLYNICLDYEPAQQRCFDESLHYELIRLLAKMPPIPDDNLPLIVELLFWTSSQKQSDSVTDELFSRGNLTKLIKLPQCYRTTLAPEDFAILVETCLLYIRDADTQREMVDSRLFESVWNMLVWNEENITSIAGHEEDEKLLAPVSVSLVWCLSDMAALPEFPTKYSLDSGWIRNNVVHTVKLPRAAQSVRLVNAACQVLGNLLWSMKEPKSFGYLVELDLLHEPILEMLNSSEDAELLHSATGLLTQLTRPLHVRDMIGSDAQARPALERLCKHESPQLRQDGTKLLRSLGRDSPANQRLFADLANEITASLSNHDTAMSET